MGISKYKKIKKTQKIWKDWEICFLKENYKVKTINQLCLKLGRTRNSVIKKASRIGIKKIRWDNVEINYLKNNFEKYTNLELSQQLGRSVDSIGHELMKLKLLKSKKALSYLWRKNGKRNIKEGKESHRWKGGTRKDSYGYVWIYSPEHINASSKYVREHRLVVENKIGRYLFREEVVHHINEIKDDNGIDNLMLFENDREHIKFHTKIRQFGMTNPILRQIENRWKKLKKPIKPNV